MDGTNDGDADESGNHGNASRRRASGLGRSRRRFLELAATSAGAFALAGCQGDGGGDGTATGTATGTASGASTGTPAPTVGPPREYAANELMDIEDWRGSGDLIQERPDQYTGHSVLDLPDLRGELTVYLGGGEGGLYENLIQRIMNLYRDFTVYIRKASSSQLANTIIEESSADQSPADIFWAIDAGSIGVVADADATVPLPERVVTSVPDIFHPTDDWVGIMGRARSIPYNTNEFDESDIPNDIMAFAEDQRFEDGMGWAPTYGAFQSFVTAMRLINGEEETRQWLEGVQEQGVQEYANELVVANTVASGELVSGFSNHYYSRLVYEERPDAPLDLAFTQGDAGALINCSGTEIIRGTNNEELAADFIHHLLSVEAQEFLATRGYEYPLLPSVPPIGDLPRIDELNPPDLDLSRLSDVRPTLQLLREVGAL